MNHRDEKVSVNPIDQSVGKHAYSTPLIQEYGNIRSITQNVGMTGMADSSPNHPNMFATRA